MYHLQIYISIIYQKFFCLQLTLVIFLHRHSWYYLVMGSIDGIFGGYLLFILKRLWLMRYIV